MAASSPLSNFLSFLLPKSPPPPQPKLAAVSMKEPAATTSTRRIEGLTATATAENSVVPADAAAVMWPSMAYTNTLYFRSAYNVQVVVDDNEPEERLLGRFRREVMRAGVIQECKRRRFHENKQDEKKRKTREAAKRNRRRRFPSRFTGPPTKTDVPSGKKEDDDDNWDLPQSVPY